ncbi:hypothetical protein ACFQ1M_05665 [Sungkyunkwania multivorans]|uniref:DUF4139 domain-containing protein n=1 Tax=Sungkyunkwania multivorans TaxID=1173618 RepID=A0ABW3CWJ8_9FLAO
MRVGRFLITIFVFASSFSLSLAQPNYQSKRQIEGITVFHDKSDPQLYYYEPGDLILKVTENDTPDFQFLDMRYTGSKCYDDAGEKSFLSLVRFGVTMNKVDPKTLQKIKSTLKSRGRATLKPLPLSAIDTRLILPVESNSEKSYQVLGEDGTLEADSKSGYSTSKAYWTERTYTVKLNKHESQLLNQQLQDNLLGLNLSYSYYADVWLPEEEITGSKELISEFEKDSTLQEDDPIKNRIVKNNTLSINIDTKKYPGAIKQLDLNEEIPPAYAAIEVKCYDFTEDLRPDLYMKIVEVEGVTVDKTKRTIIETKFLRKHSDLNTKHIQFPYAVRIDASMRYRITEVDINGIRMVHDWKDKEECSSIIDVTSTNEQQKVATKEVDIEMDMTSFTEASLSKVEVYIGYIFNNTAQVETITFKETDELPVQFLAMKHDKDTPLYYLVKKYDSDGNLIAGKEARQLTDNYLYVE